MCGEDDAMGLVRRRAGLRDVERASVYRYLQANGERIQGEVCG
jgi:hypothetical protein